MLNKTIISFLFLIFLCSTTSVAQDKLNKKDEYEKLVDFVNCYYVKAYIDYRSFEDKNTKTRFGNNLKTHYAINKKKIDIQFYSHAPDYKQIKGVIYNGNESTETLCFAIESKKKNFDEKWDKEAVIEVLINVPNGYSMLDNKKQVLESILQDQIPEILFTPSVETDFKITSVKIPNISVLLDSTITITARISPKEAKYRRIGWEVIDNNSVIEIIRESDQYCIIKANRIGKAEIKVTVDDQFYISKITVTEKSEIEWCWLIASIMCLIVLLFLRIKKWKVISKKKPQKMIYYVFIGLFLFMLLYALKLIVALILLLTVVLSFTAYKTGALKFLYNKFKDYKQSKNPNSNEDIETKSIVNEKKRKKRTTEVRTDNRVTESNKNKQLASEKISPTYEYFSVESTPLIIENDLYNFDEEFDVEPEEEPDVEPEEIYLNSNLLYANFIEDNEFKNVIIGEPCTMSVFELKLTGNDTATFEVYENAKGRVIDRPNYLAGCHKEITPEGTNLTQEEGKACKQGDKWIVVKPLKVIIS